MALTVPPWILKRGKLETFGQKPIPLKEQIGKNPAADKKKTFEKKISGPIGLALSVIGLASSASGLASSACPADEASPPRDEASPFGPYIFTKLSPSFFSSFFSPWLFMPRKIE